MRPRSLGSRWIAVLVAAPLFVSLACSSSQPIAHSETTQPSDVSSITTSSSNAAAATSPATNPATTTAAATAPTEAPAVTGPETYPQTLDAELEFGPGPFNLTETDAGLSTLSSHTATLSVAFDGTNGGQPSSWTRTYALLAKNEPAVRQVSIEQGGDLAALGPVFIAEVDGASYEQDGDDPCTVDVITEDDPLADQFDLTGFLQPVIGADSAGADSANGAAADHYTFDERAVGEAGVATETGDIWVATDGGYVVKYVQTTNGAADYFGEGIDGTLSLDYELTSINQPVLLTIPPGCPSDVASVPALPDASNIQTEPSESTFVTATSLADIVAFYQTALPSLGWVPEGDPTVDETSALVDFTQGDKALSVAANTESGVTTVEITVFPNVAPDG